MKGILNAAGLAIALGLGALPALAQSTTPDGRPISPTGISDTSGRPISPAGITDTSGRPIDPAGINDSCRGSNSNECASNDPFGTRRDLAGRPIRPDGIGRPDAAAVTAPTDSECKLPWISTSRWPREDFLRLCVGRI